MKNRKLLYFCAIAVLLVAAAGAAWYFFFARPAKAPSEEGAGPSEPSLIADNGANGSTHTRKRPRKTVKAATPFGDIELEVADEWEDFAPEDQRRMEAIEEAMENENLEALIAMIPDITTSTNAAVRMGIVDSLDWFGEKAALDLLPFMADSDDEVASAASDAWQRAISEIEDEKYKFNLVEQSMKAITNKEALETICDELIGGDDLAAIQILVNIIAGENEAAREVAIEQYSFITGEDYVDFQTAEEWVKENLSSSSAEETAAGEDGQAEDAESQIEEEPNDGAR